MSQTLIKRLARLPVTLFAVSVLVFAIMALGPDPMSVLRESADMTPADLARFAHANGLDMPLWQQYLRWLTHFVRGDWGHSIITFQPATQMIFQRLPLSLTIAACALALSAGIGLPLGALMAVRRDSTLDRSANVLTLALLATPAFLVGILLQLGAVVVRNVTGHPILYTSGVPDTGHSPVTWARYLALPVLTLALTHIAVWMRYQRAELLAVLGQEYVKAARAKGLAERTVVVRHALRNALLPIVTLIASDLGKLVGGAMIVEWVFNLPGVGLLMLQSVMGDDTTVLLDVVMLIGVAVLVSNTLADLAYGLLDPRVRDA